MKRQKDTTVKCPDCGLHIPIETHYLITQPIENQCLYCYATFELKLELKSSATWPKRF